MMLSKYLYGNISSTPQGLTPWWESAAGGDFAHSVATVTIAANDAPYKQKMSADVICDGVNDEIEIRAAITDAATDGGGFIQLTEGIFNFEATAPSTIAGLSNLIFAGRGQKTIIRGKDLGTGNANNLLKFSTTNNVIFRDMKIDINGNDRYGGITFQGGSRIWINNVSVVDGAPKSSPSVDKYSFLFTSNATDDVWFTNNTIDGCQPEFSRATNLVLSGNILKNCIQTTVLPLLALGASQTVENMVIANNHIIVDDNSILGSKDIGLISIAVDANTLSGTVNKKIIIRDNFLRYTTNGAAAILIGTTSSGSPGGATKPILNDIVISGNHIVYDNDENPGASNAAILINNNSSVSAYDLDRIIIKKNYIKGNNSGGMTGIITSDADHCEISRNIVEGCTYGYSFRGMKDSRFFRNSALNCVTTGFDYFSTRGGNIFRDNDVYGTTIASTPYNFRASNSNDKIIPFIPTAPSADLEDATNQYKFVKTTDAALQFSTLSIIDSITHGNSVSSATEANTLMKIIRQVDVPDDSATEVFNITTTDGQTGTYTALIYTMVTNGHGAGNTNTSAQSNIHMLTRAKHNTAGDYNFTEIHAGSSVATGASYNSINAVTVTASETDENIMSVKFRVDIIGSNPTFGTGTDRTRVHSWVHLIHHDFQTTPTIT